MSILAKARRSAAEFMYSRLRHAREMQSRITGLSEVNEAVQTNRAAERILLQAQQRQSFVMHRNFYENSVPLEVAEVGHSAHQSDALLKRIQRSYRAATDHDSDRGQSFWTEDYARKKAAEHAALTADDVTALREIFLDPGSSALFYGFDLLNRIDTPDAHTAHVPWRTQWIYDNLLRLCEAVGAMRLEYPETGDVPEYVHADLLLSRLDLALGFRIDFPTPYAGEVGLRTSRGIASYRAIQAIYQAWLIKQSGAETVVEIGAGLGRTAYYSHRAGVKSYTIVDLPMTNAPQSHFLATAINADAVSLYGENSNAPIRIMPADAFLSSDSKCDIILNVDSMTEMSREYATQYFDAAMKRARALLSINHEHNDFTVREIAGDNRAVSRQHCWMRRGYVEEMFEF